MKIGQHTVTELIMAESSCSSYSPCRLAQ